MKRIAISRAAFALAMEIWGLDARDVSAAGSNGPLDLASPATLQVYGDLRVAAANGELSWTEGGFGKLRYGGSASTSLEPRLQISEAGLIWQPQLGWALSGTMVALVQSQGGRQTEAGLSEAFLSYKPLGDGPVKISWRGGLMWPPVSIEHSGPEWTVTDTITPSAIGSWVGEEVKVLGVELTTKLNISEHAIAVTIAGFDFNDTAGTLLTFRGWALHDRKALVARRQPLPPLNNFVEPVQPRFTHAVLDIDPGLLKRPGYYGKLVWSPPVPLRLEAFHYDNNGDPLSANPDLEWGWRTQFNTLAVIADLGKGRELRAQGLTGRTRMGQSIADRDWIDMRFRAGFGQVTQRFAQSTITVRLDLFSTRNHGSAVDMEDDEQGWAATVGAKHEFTPKFSALVEYLHVDSDRAARQRTLVGASQAQDQLQLALRARW